MKIIDKHNVSKILIIKLRGIGDVVLSTIVIKNLKSDFPEAEIDFLTDSPSQKFLANIPEINKVIIFRKKNLFDRIMQIMEIRKQKYDLVLDFYSNPATALITRFSGAEYRAGFPYKGRKYAYNLYGPSERGKYHAAALHLEFLKKIGLTSSFDTLVFNTTQNDVEFAGNFINKEFSENDFIVGICPSGGWPSKKCDPSKFAEIADLMVSEFKAKICILWGPGDEKDASEIKSKMKSSAVIIPKADICQLAELIKKCKIIIANDSGPMHIATAVGTPVLSLHGPTSPKLQGPYGTKHEWYRLENLDCIECNLLVCNREHECFKNISMENVKNKIKILIQKNDI